MGSVRVERSCKNVWALCLIMLLRSSFSTPVRGKWTPRYEVFPLPSDSYHIFFFILVYFEINSVNQSRKGPQVLFQLFEFTFINYYRRNTRYEHRNSALALGDTLRKSKPRVHKVRYHKKHNWLTRYTYFYGYAIIRIMLDVAITPVLYL
jgi:hypothetical protein